MRIGLYPYIPDAARFAERIERAFEAQHPGIDLVIVDMGEMKERNLAYDPTRAAEALSAELDVLEVDTVVLGALEATGALQPVRGKGPFFPFAEGAVTIRSTAYGVPHWTCGYFLMTRVPEVLDVPLDLRSILEALAEHGHSSLPDITGKLSGRYRSVMLYLDAYSDVVGPGHDASALSAVQLPDRLRAALEPLGQACRTNGKSACGDDPEAPARAYGLGAADALFGYSERLNLALSSTPAANIDGTVVRPISFGNAAARPIFFTDALVLSKRCRGRCRSAAEAFMAFVVEAEIFERSMLGWDGRRPRYLLASTPAAMQRPRIASDPIYGQFLPFLERGVPFPNRGIPEAMAAGTWRPLMDEALALPTATSSVP